MLVYHILRALSDSALNFYSEVHVEGQYNVPADGPLIVCVRFAVASERWIDFVLTADVCTSVSCHHNEILDIATLGSFSCSMLRCLETQRNPLLISWRSDWT